MLTEQDSHFIKAAAPNALVVIQFAQEKDLFLVFCTDESKDGQLTGLTLWGLRKSRGPTPNPLHQDFVPMMFRPRLMQKSEKEYRLNIEPLQETITLLRKSSHFSAFYPFKQEKKLGQIIDVTVDYAISPMKMWFTVNGQFKPHKDSKPVPLSHTVECPTEFTNALYQFFQK